VAPEKYDSHSSNAEEAPEVQTKTPSRHGSSSCGVAVVDSRLKVVQTDPRLKGWLDLELRDKSSACYNYLWGKDEPCSQCPYCRENAEENGPVSFVHEYYSPTKGTGHYRVISIPLRPLTHGPDCILEIVQDISQEIDEKKDHHKENFFTDLLESSLEAFFVTNLNGTITHLSKGGEKILGYTTDEIVGKPVSDFYVQGQQEAQKIMEMLYKHEACPNYETRVFNREGRILTLTISLSLLRNNQGEVIGTLGIGKDITEVKRIERRMQQSDKMATVGELAAGLAHEIGTPLTVIQGTTEYLMMDVDADDPNRQEFETILSQTSRITELVEQLLNFSRYSNPEMGPVNVNDLILDVLSLMDHQINKYNCFVETIFEPDLPVVSGDKNQLEQAFLNILLNAVQSMQDNGTITITTRSIRNNGTWVAVSFADTGCGISDLSIQRLFDPFFTTKSVGKSTGLGLTASHRIVEDHNGIIEVESSLGKGSTFTIKIPYEDHGNLSKHDS
jgi:PAS domain S-box-containing protein